MFHSTSVRRHRSRAMHFRWVHKGNKIIATEEDGILPPPQYPIGGVADIPQKAGTQYLIPDSLPFARNQQIQIGKF
jgi:hypothetical protein